MRVRYSLFKKFLVNIISITVFTLLSFGCQANDNNANADKINKEPLQQWQGDLPLAVLKQLPPASYKAGMGYINNQKTLDVIWPAIQNDTAKPDINFEKNIIVYVYNREFYNRTRISKIEVRSGVAEIIAMETLSALPIKDKVAFAMVLIEKEGITGLQTTDGLLTIYQQP